MRKFDLAKVRALYLAALVVGLFFGSFGITNSKAAAFNVGVKKCTECHAVETKVWEGTEHAKSYKKVHKNKNAKKIVRAVGDKRMKKSKTCGLCHYTAVQKASGKKSKNAFGPSCESCHGASSGWINVHNDYGKGVKRDQESADHKAERIKKSNAAGMIRPAMLYDVAANCMSCHGLVNPNLDPKKAAIMLDNKHPLNPDFELVKYSQGSIRHRFYPPEVTVNQEMTEAEKAQLYVIGQAAALVSATNGFSNSDHALYKAAQEKRIANAKAALDLIKGTIPEAAKIMSNPTAENGRALWAAIKGKDLTGAVGSKLPKDYK
tara:strand:+ start:2730 stop:3689 length:960 start_codon:yes stop_codon:yes gene_type:complete